VADPQVVRPLLGDDPAGLMRNLLARREGYYGRADARVDAGDTRSPDRVAAEVVLLSSFLITT
jgi:hypothetical protein